MARTRCRRCGTSYSRKGFLGLELCRNGVAKITVDYERKPKVQHYRNCPCGNTIVKEEAA